MAEAKDDSELSDITPCECHNSGSVSEDFPFNHPSDYQANFLRSSQLQCSGCPVLRDDGDSDCSIRRHSFHSDASYLRQNSLFNNEATSSKDERLVSCEGDSEERENGYPLVADLSGMHFRRNSEDLSERRTQSLRPQINDQNLDVDEISDEMKDIMEEPSAENRFQQLENNFLRDADAEVDEQHRQLLDAVESAMDSFYAGEGPSNICSAPRNSRTSMTSFDFWSLRKDCHQEQPFRATDHSYAALPEKKIPTLNRVPTLTFDIPLSPVNPLRALSNNKGYFSNQSSQKPNFGRATFCRKQASHYFEHESSKKTKESITSWIPSEKAGPSFHATSSWQATKGNLKERISFMCCNDLLADVYFLVGRGEAQKKFPAHKFILVTASAVFDAMFNGELNKTSHDDNVSDVDEKQKIELPDVEPSAFNALLRFLYSDEVCIGPENVMTTLYAAKKYAIPALEKVCVDFLKENLCAENAFLLLTQAILFDEHHLTEMCLEIIDRNTLDALNAEDFLEIDLDTLCMVLVRETLRVPEAPLYLAVLRWSEEQCRRRNLPVTPANQRLVLGKALYLIRFPLMTVDEFAQHVAQSGILSDREVVNIFVYFTVNPKPNIVFPTSPRCCVFGKEVVVSRFQRVEARWGYSGTPDRIKFTVDKRIFVLGFGLHGSIHGPHEYAVLIQIVHCGTGKVLASCDTSFTCDGSNSTFRVMFKEPVEIIPCITYIASARLKGPDSHYGSKGLRRIVHQSPSSGVVTFQFTYAAGNNNGTSVEDGQIPEIIFCTKVA